MVRNTKMKTLIVWEIWLHMGRKSQLFLSLVWLTIQYTKGEHTPQQPYIINPLEQNTLCGRGKLTLNQVNIHTNTYTQSTTQYAKR